jgi:hypothetical protein
MMYHALTDKIYGEKSTAIACYGSKPDDTGVAVAMRPNPVGTRLALSAKRAIRVKSILCRGIYRP